MSRFKELKLTSKIAKEGERDIERGVAVSLLKSLIEEEKEKVFISFILTRKNNSIMSEKLLKVLRIANFMLTDENAYFHKLAFEKFGKRFVLKNSLPMIIFSEDAEIDLIDGFENDVKLHRVSVEMVDFIDFEKNDNGLVSVSAREGSSSAGKVASRTLRTLVNDQKDALLRFVMTKRNAQVMSEKIFSMQKIMYRMSKEPASEIDSALANAKIDYEIECYGPFVSRERIETKEQVLEEKTILVNKIYYKLK